MRLVRTAAVGRGHFRRFMPPGCALLAAFCLCLGGCGGDSGQDPRAGAKDEPTPTPTAQMPPQWSGHDQMLDLLARINESAVADSPYLGNRIVRELSTELAGLGEDAPDLQRWSILRKLGVAELNLGLEQSGVDRLDEAVRLMPKIIDKIGNDWLLETVFQLGVGYLRQGETQNCCARNTPDSCIMPIRGGGVHTVKGGSQRAIECFLRVLQPPAREGQRPLEARWLLNIAYMTLGEYPDGVPKEHLIPPSAFESKMPFPRFRNIAPELGLDTFDLSGGVVLDDFDGDHYLDILTSCWHTSGPMHLFHNNRDGSFTEITQEAGLKGLLGGLNLVQADYDNDGDVDVLVLRGAWMAQAGRYPNSLLRNNGDGRFTDVTFEAGLSEVLYPTQTASWADYDNDGDLDLYIGNETTLRLTSAYIGEGKTARLSAPNVGTADAFGLTAPCQLFRNNGNGTFTDVARSAGVENLRYAKSVIWADYDSDRFPDLYVSNLDDPNRLYRNNRDGTFTDVAASLGVDRPIRSFPAWFWDFNNDGALDIFVSTYDGRLDKVAAYHLGLPTTYEYASLYRGDGNGGFEEVALAYNLDYPMLPMGANFGDLDGDSFPDFYLGTGDPLYLTLMPNVMFLNVGGTSFVNVTMAGGFGHLQKGHGVAFADLDHDGDLDLFEQLGGAVPGDGFHNALFENPGFGYPWITVKLVGTQSNRSAIGARVHVLVEDNGKNRSVYRHVNSGGSFGASPLRQTIGLGSTERIVQLEVFWPTTGRTQRFSDVPMNQAIRIVEGEESYAPLELKSFPFATAANKPTPPQH